MSPITERLHDRLHKLPGMPPHSEADRLHQHLHAHDHEGVHHPHTRPPRVLVAWQNWIGGLFAGRADRR